LVALFFVLERMIDRFVCLKSGVSLVLVFVGITMLGSQWGEIPAAASLTLNVAILATVVGLSLRQSIGRARLTAVPS
jgi:tellurite resistance protein TerC